MRIVEGELTHALRIQIAREHFERKGYRVHSGLQFGVELVLYADDPQRVHSDFCVHVLPSESTLDWRMMQTLVRSMPDLHKTLILVHISKEPSPTVFASRGILMREDFKNPTVSNDLNPSSTTASILSKNEIDVVPSNTDTTNKCFSCTCCSGGMFRVKEVAMASEHAPFRHRKMLTSVGLQKKQQK